MSCYPRRPAALAFLIFLLAIHQTFAEDLVFQFSRTWLDIERTMLESSAGEQTEALLGMVGDFRSSLKQVFESPLYQSYRFNPNFHGETIEALFELSASFEAALREGREAALPALALDIHATLNKWQEQDAKMADAVHLRYFYQFFIFAGVICLFALTVWFLNRAFKGSLLREERSAAFSRDMALAQDEERSRIALELHDSVIQDLRQVSFMGYAQNAEKLDAEKLSARCDDLITRIREICQALIPPNFEKIGLLESLKDLCINFEKTNGVECRLVAPPDLCIASLSKEMELQVYRIIQEALSNIEKHAKASEVSVALRNEGAGETLFICITDDGVGFDPSRAEMNTYQPGHLGIQGMYNRTAILGGKLSFESEKGAGVMVRIELPLKNLLG